MMTEKVVDQLRDEDKWLYVCLYYDIYGSFGNSVSFGLHLSIKYFRYLDNRGKEKVRDFNDP